jgi:hypothetical protein
VDNLGQLYVLDSEDEGTDMEAGLYAPDSEEEDGGSCGGRRQLYRRAVVPSMVKKMAEKMTMVPNLAVEMATVADPAPEVAMAVDVPVADPAPEVAPDVDVPVGAATPLMNYSQR